MHVRWLIIMIVSCSPIVHTTLDFNYHNYTQMTNFLQTIADEYKASSYLYEVGKSEQGREVLLHLVEYLLTSNDVQVQRLMNLSRIHIMPSMNPDGYEISKEGDCGSADGRYTANNIDLNRNFPDYLSQPLISSITATETKAVIDWLKNITFVLSANYHGGAFVINVPYDRYCNNKLEFLLFLFYLKIFWYIFSDNHNSAITDDDDIYMLFANAYVNMTNATNENCDSGVLPSTHVIRGADWFEIVGSMQDYGYLNYGTIEMTMEISCCKYPLSTLNSLDDYYNYNRDAMIELLLQAQRGVKGFVFDENNNPIPFTQIMINNRRPVINVTALGEFWRILLPGDYILKVFFYGYEVYRQQITINNTSPLNLIIIISNTTLNQYA
ncbi:unnamed protein product, partial [Didymodactylos carnosus]